MKYEDIYIQYMYSYPHKTAYRDFEKEISLDEYKPLLKQQDNSLYFHIPFCESKCGYCNLFSVTGKDEEYVSKYLEACSRQTKQYGMEDIEFSSLTIGGGTPLLLNEEQLDKLFKLAYNGFGWKKQYVAGKTQVIIETSPNQTTQDKLSILKENNVTRVSIGVQSFVQQELDNLYRHHSVETAKRALKLLKDKKFDCLNLDLIYGIKGQTIETLRKSLEEACYYEPEEIFIYPLYVKTGTIMDIKQEKATADRYEFYCFIRDFLKNKGYTQTSMRRFVRKKSENINNNNISCGFENTISIGCGGRSYIGNLHFCTPYSVKQDNCKKILDIYMQKEDYTKISYGYILTEEELRRRYVIKNLLVSCGISKEDYSIRFNSDVLEDYKELKPFLEKKYIIDNGSRVYLMEEGMALSDYIGPTLISKEVQERMVKWQDGMGIYE